MLENYAFSKCRPRDRMDATAWIRGSCPFEAEPDRGVCSRAVQRTGWARPVVVSPWEVPPVTCRVSVGFPGVEAVAVRLQRTSEVFADHVRGVGCAPGLKGRLEKLAAALHGVAEIGGAW